MKELRKVWHQEVDKIFDKADEILSSMQELSIASLSRHQDQIKGKIKEMEQAIKEQKQVIKGNKASKINGYISKLRDYREMPETTDFKVPSLITDTVQGRELLMEIATFRAKLSQSSVSSLSQDVQSTPKGILLDAKVISTIPTDFNSLSTVSCVGSDEAWISGDNEFETITRVDIHGSVQDTVIITGDYWPNDIAVTRQGELIYSDCTSKTVKIVSHGEDPDPYHHTTELGTMPAVLHQIRGHPEGVYILCMAENNNGDICVTDINADKVVVVSRTGRVRFRYDGTPVRKEKSFDPRDIVTDSLSQIIVADYKNHCLHILDQDGIFLGCVDMCGLDKPYGLSVDSKGRLWVALNKIGKIKVLSI